LSLIVVLGLDRNSATRESDAELRFKKTQVWLNIRPQSFKACRLFRTIARYPFYNLVVSTKTVAFPALHRVDTATKGNQQSLFPTAPQYFPDWKPSIKLQKNEVLPKMQP
jgi:hypothetical protein